MGQDYHPGAELGRTAVSDSRQRWAVSRHSVGGMDTYTTMRSPLGELVIVGSDEGLVRVSFGGETAGLRYAPEEFGGVVAQLHEYFEGTRQAFDLPYAQRGTEFQREVWAAVEAIPYGTTTSYGELTAAVGAARDRVRAVAAAIGANPLLVLRPCHRVVGADGSLTGYAGGLERKRRLLTLEGALQPLFA